MFVLFAFGALFSVVVDATSYAPDPEPIEFRGQVKIAMLLDIHSSEKNNGDACANFKPLSVQKFLAAVWAVRLLNSQNEPNATTIGLTVYDTCGSTETALRQIHRIVERERKLEHPDEECENATTTDVPLLGVIGLGETKILNSAATILNAFSIPMIVASPGGDYSLLQVNNVLYTAPEMASQVTSVLGVLRAFRWESARIVSSSFTALREFSASASGVQVARAVHLSRDKVDGEILDQIFENYVDGPLVVVALLEPEQLRQLSGLVKDYKAHHDVSTVTWIVASPSLDRYSMREYVEDLGPGIFVEPHAPEMAGFQQFYESALLNAELLGKDASGLISLYNRTKARDGFPTEEFYQVPGVAHVTEAASALAAGLRILTLDSCHRAARCQALTHPIAAAMLGALRKLGLSFHRDQPLEVEGSRLRFTDSGRLVTVHSHVIFFNGTHPPALIGWFSEELGVSLVTVPGSLARTRLDANEYQHMWAERVAASTASSSSPLSQDVVDIVVERVSHRTTERRAWAAAVLASACVSVIVILHICIYVLRKLCSSGELLKEMIQPLDVAFAFVIGAMYASCIFVLLPSFHGAVGWQLLIHSTMHAVCYAVMLAQTLSTRWKNLLGVGGSLDTPSLLLIVVLAAVPQVLVSSLWLSWAAPAAAHLSPLSGAVHRSALNGELVVLHVPAILLLVTVAAFSADNRSPGGCSLDPRNRWLFLAAVVCMPIWAGWAAITFAAAPDVQEHVACAHLLTVATVVGLAVFAPRVAALRNPDSALHRKKLPLPETSTTVFSISLEHQVPSTFYKLAPPKLLTMSDQPHVEIKT